jgi:hypothetical protein
MSNCQIKDKPYNQICWEGDWRELPQQCSDGIIEVWDQTMGCTACGMNIWYLPAYGMWPEWDKENEPPSDWWKTVRTNPDMNPYDPYVALFIKIHLYSFNYFGDPGDEDNNGASIYTIGP